jgi:hypothetical protein
LVAELFRVRRNCGKLHRFQCLAATVLHQVMAECVCGVLGAVERRCSLLLVGPWCV